MSAFLRPSGQASPSGAALQRLLLALFLLPLWLSLDVSSIWDANEAFYVETPRQMLQRDDLIVPYFNGQERLNKPPLSYWIVALFYQLMGVSVLAQRLAIALFASASVLAVYRIGRGLFPDPWTAVLAAGAFATAFRFVILSRRLMIDILLLFCVLACFYFFLCWIRRGRPRDFLLVCLFLGLGFLAKGPVALLSAGVMFSFLLATGRLGRLRRAPLARGAALWLAVAGSWYMMLGMHQGWGPVIDFFLLENLGRFSHVDFGPSRGPLYYLGVFFTEFLPWSFLFPFAVAWGWRPIASRLKGGDCSEAQRERSDALIFLGLWFVLYFLVFSLSRNKQEYYILPVYPAAALWIAAFLRSGAAQWWKRAPAALAAAAAAAAIGALAWTILFESTFAWALPALFLLASGAALALGRNAWAAPLLSLFYASAFLFYLGPMERYRPVRPLAETIRQHAAARGPDGFEAGYYRLTSPSLAYYLGKPVLEIYDSEAALQALGSQRPVYLIMRDNDYQSLLEASGSLQLEVVETRPKLYTTAKRLVRILGSERGNPSEWTRPVHLVTNRDAE